MDLEVLFRLGSNGILAASVTSADRPLLQAMLAPSSHTLIPCRMLALAFKKKQRPVPWSQISSYPIGFVVNVSFQASPLGDVRSELLQRPLTDQEFSQVRSTDYENCSLR